MSTLNNLHGKKLNGHFLHLGELKQLRLSGWKGFKLFLTNPQGLLSENPVIKGIYSSGGKDGVRPWMDVDYREELEFSGFPERREKFSLSSSRLDQKLFGLLGGLIPPGGHFMVSYEGEQKVHTDTIQSLSAGVPPATTPLGHLVFRSGFQYIKDWYLAEGGFEGPRKIWGEKAPDELWAQNFYERTAEQVSQFLKKPVSSAYRALIKAARKRAEETMKIINSHLKH
ncbi:MAG: DUF1122 family protein [Candidatus Aminicenantes bacterium]|nr:DUF1122 family protein [Candidatus Aminicenantes bacterium]